MKIPVTGRNDPCPCGSGKKFKGCCLGKDGLGTSGRGGTGASAELRQALEGRQFTSLSEVQEFIEHHTQQRNQTPVDEFHGLSPEQMHRMLHFPFASPEVIRFPAILDTNPKAPILTLFSLLTETIGEQGLKPTAKGNLPQKFCREAALAYWGETAYRENTRLGGINREYDFPDLHITRLVAELAGLIRKHKGRFILGRDCRALLAGEGPAAIYPRLFRAYVEQFNWAYRDRRVELRFIRATFLFTLYLLTFTVKTGCHMNSMKTVFCAPSPCCWTKCRRTRCLPRRRKCAPATPGARSGILPGFLVWPRWTLFPKNTFITGIV